MAPKDPSETVRWLEPAELDTWKNLQRMQAQLTGRLARELSATSPLSLQDYMVLVVLSEQPWGRLRAFELGLEMGWEKSRLSHHVARMDARGLVERQRCPSDQRGLEVVITPQGRRALDAAAPGHVAAVRRWFVDLLDPAELATLASAAAKVIAALSADPDPAPGPGAPGP